MTLAYITKLGFLTLKITVDAQKIDGSALATYEIVIAYFLLQNKLQKIWFFEKAFYWLTSLWR